MISPASNGDLITVMTPRNGILNESARKCLTTTSQVIYLTDSCHPFKESNFAITKATYWPCITCSCSLLPVKVFHFVQLLRVPFCALDWILFHELLNKSVRSLKFAQLNFVFLTNTYTIFLLKMLPEEQLPAPLKSLQRYFLNSKLMNALIWNTLGEYFNFSYVFYSILMYFKNYIVDIYNFEHFLSFMLQTLFSFLTLSRKVLESIYFAI